MSRPLTLADGQVAATATEILGGASVPGTKVSARFANVGATTETVVVTFKRAGGTARRVARFVLAADATAYVLGLAMQADDSLLAQTTNAATVDYLVTDGSDDKFQAFSLDANGALKSGSASLSGSATLLGPIGLGAAAPTNPQALFAVLPQTFAGVTANQSYFHEQLLPGGATTVPTGTAPVVASLNVHEPNITATGTVTDATTVRVADAPTEGTNNYALWVDSGAVRIDSDILLGGAPGAAATTRKLVIAPKACADNTATDLVTVTVPNVNASACLKITLLGRSGGSDAYESTRVAEGMVVLARTSGANVVATAATLEMAGIATVSGGDTFTLAYAASSITGGVTATNTFTITVTLNSVGNQACSCMALVELINENTGGITVAAS